MNVERLGEIVGVLLEAEGNFKIQKLLNELKTSLDNVTSSPQEANLQQDYANKLADLKVGFGRMIYEFKPAEVELMTEIGAKELFVSDLGTEIAELVRENPVSPSVARDFVAELVKRRSQYISQMEALKTILENLNVGPEEDDPGSAQVGVTIPRDLFDNSLDGLIGQLDKFRRLARIFSEVSTGEAPIIEVRQISTTDPLFFFGMAVSTVLALSRSMSWALDQWLKIEKIRKLRAETSQLESFSEDELKFFDDKIDTIIEEAVATKVTESMEERTVPAGARAMPELENQLSWAYKTVFALVERGLKMEIRFLPPVTEEGEDEEREIPQEYQDLSDVSRTLIFPKVEGRPTYEIPAPPPENPNGS